MSSQSTESKVMQTHEAERQQIKRLIYALSISRTDAGPLSGHADFSRSSISSRCKSQEAISNYMLRICSRFRLSQLSGCSFSSLCRRLDESRSVW